MALNESCKAPIVEPVTIHDTYVSQLARIEKLSGGNIRFTFVTEHEDDTGKPVKVVCLRIIMHAEDVLSAARISLITAGGILCAACAGGLSLLH